jgi:hypothetical protein
MRISVKQLSSLVMVLALAIVPVWASKTTKVRKVSVTFPDPISVNGTVVKAGTYRLHFDEESGELTIRRNGDVLATTKARLEKRDSKATRTSITTQADGDKNELVSVSEDGKDENIVVAKE